MGFMIFGKPLSDYVAFCKPFLILIPLVGIVRLIVSLNGVPNNTALLFSMNALLWIGVIYYSIRVHTTGFGSFKHLLVICALLNISAQVISVLGILVAIFTDTNNVYSSPEFAFGRDGKTWLHVGLHLVVGITAGSIVPWLVGSLIQAITRKVTRVPAGQTSGSAI
jgi:hypothetical protein